MYLIENIKALRDSLVELDIHLTMFPFHYNGYNYTVIFENASNLKDAEKYAIALLTFTRRDDFSDQFCVFANRSGFFGKDMEKDKNRFFHYFYIKYDPNRSYQAFFEAFYANFERFIPLHAVKITDAEEKKQTVQILSIREGVNPNARFCYKAQHNKKSPVTGKRGRRSPINSQKTALLYPELFQKLKADITLSFYYTDDPTKERKTEDILANVDKDIYRL